MTQVYLRQTEGIKLTIPQADESLTHLSNAEQVSTDVQLYTGGVYESVGTNILTMPADGNRVTIIVKTGTAQLIGDIDGDIDPTIGVGAARVYVKFASVWRLVTDYFARYRVIYTDNLTADVNFPHVAIDAATAKTYTLPDTFAVNTAFTIVRHDALVTVATSGAELIYHPVTDSLVATIDLNFKGVITEFYKGTSSWFYGTTPI